MGISGRGLLRDYTLEEVIELLHEHGGRVAKVAEAMHCGTRAVYDLLDVYPELVEARKDAQARKRDMAIETSEDVLEKLKQMVEEDPANARMVATFILSKAKESPYYDGTSDSGDEKADRFVEALEKYVDAHT